MVLYLRCVMVQWYGEPWKFNALGKSGEDYYCTRNEINQQHGACRQETFRNDCR